MNWNMKQSQWHPLAVFTCLNVGKLAKKAILKEGFLCNNLVK